MNPQQHGMTLEQVGALCGILVAIVSLIGGPVSILLIINRLQDTTQRLEKGQDHLGERLNTMQSEITSRNEQLTALQVQVHEQQKQQEQHYEQDSERFARTDRGIEGLANSMQKYLGNLELRLASMEGAVNKLSQRLGRRNGDHAEQQESG
jgi:hypothetical protein